MLIFEIVELFEKEFVLELEIFCPFKFDSEFTDFILWDAKLIFEAANFALVVLEVIFGEIVLVDAFFELILKFEL